MVDGLFILSFIVAIDISNANLVVALKTLLKVVYHDGCHHRFASSRNAGTEKRRLGPVKPCLKFSRIEKPLPSPFLASIDEIALLCRIVRR